MPGYNIHKLEKVAVGLDGLLGRVIFIGGSVLELYATDTSAPEFRPSREIDCLLNIETAGEFLAWEQEIEARGFRKMPHEVPGQATQSWRFEDIRLTFTYPNFSGHSKFNRWYQDGIFHATPYRLSSGTMIRIFTPPYVIATKIEAFLHRGNQDFRLSEDFEDIVYLLDNRPQIKREVLSAYHEVRNYIRAHFDLFLASGDLEEGLAYVLPFGSGTSRIRRIIDLMREFVGESYKPQAASRKLPATSPS